MHLSISDLNRLGDILSRFAEETGRSPSEAIDLLETIVEREVQGRTTPAGILALFVDRVRQIRMRRNRMVGAKLFRDPAWDMLLELFIAHEQDRPVSVTSLCYASGVPATTALRQLQRLERHGMITRSGDPSDERRYFIRATPKAIEAIGAAARMLMEQAVHIDEINSPAKGKAKPKPSESEPSGETARDE